MRKRARYVAEMHFEDLLATAEIADHLEDILAHAVATFRPRTHAEREPPVPAVAGDLLGTVVPVVVSEKFGHAVHLGNRRIVGKECEFHARLLGHRQHRLHEIRVVSPDLVRRILPLELLLFHAIPEIVQVEFPRRVSAPPHRVRRVCVGRVEIVRRDRDPETPHIAQELCVRFDVLVAPRLAQLNLPRAIRIVNARVDLHAEPGEPLLRGAEVIDADVACFELQPHPLQPDLLQEAQVIVRDGSGVQPVTELDVSGIGLVDGPAPILREQGPSGCAHRGLEKLSPTHKDNHRAGSP